MVALEFDQNRKKLKTYTFRCISGGDGNEIVNLKTESRRSKLVIELGQTRPS